MNKFISIIVVHPFPVVREGTVSLLNNEADLAIVEAATYDEAINLSQKLRPTLLVLGLDVLDSSLPLLIRSFRQISPSTNILVLAASCDKVYVQTLVKAGIKGYALMREPTSQLVSAMLAVAQGKTWFSQRVTEKLVQEIKREPVVMLTPRQLAVLQLVAQGKTNRQITQELDITERTVRFHLEKIFARLNVQNRTEAVIKAVELSWLDLPT